MAIFVDVNPCVMWLQVEATADVGDAPKFIRTLESVTVQLGETIRLVCQVASHHEVIVTWLKQTQELVGDRYQ